MKQPERLEDILRKNDAAKDYWRGVVDAQSQRAEPERPDCDTCGGEGYLLYRFVRDGVVVKSEYAPCNAPACAALAARRDERYAKLSTLSQIPTEYLAPEISLEGWEALLRDFPEHADGKRDAHGAALAFLAASERGFDFTLDDAADQAGLPRPSEASAARCSIVFTGAWGVGKTSLACAIARTLIDAGTLAVYVLMSEFFEGLKERFREKGSYEFGGDAEDGAQLLRTYQQAPVLIIDELALPASDWQRQQAYALINYRYIYHLPTVITTNHNADLLSDEVRGWGMATGSRLQAFAHWFRMSGLELRRRDAEIVSR